MQNMTTRKVDPSESKPLTLEQLHRVIPPNKRNLVTKGVVEEINKTLEHPQYREHFRENFLSYTSVLQDGKYRILEYVSAVKYVSLKLLGDSNTVAYSKVFPERYQRLIDEGADKYKIAAFVGAFNRTQLVNKILEQTLVPHYVLNQDLYQKALNTQAELMTTAKSEKVRSDAANSLLVHLKMPETQKFSVDVNVKEDDSIKELRNTTLELVKQQRKMIKANAMNAREVVESKLIAEDVEFTEVSSN